LEAPRMAARQREGAHKHLNGSSGSKAAGIDLSWRLEAGLRFVEDKRTARKWPEFHTG